MFIWVSPQWNIHTFIHRKLYFTFTRPATMGIWDTIAWFSSSSKMSSGWIAEYAGIGVRLICERLIHPGPWVSNNVLQKQQRLSSSSSCFWLSLSSSPASSSSASSSAVSSSLCSNLQLISANGQSFLLWNICMVLEILHGYLHACEASTRDKMFYHKLHTKRSSPIHDTEPYGFQVRSFSRTSHHILCKIFVLEGLMAAMLQGERLFPLEWITHSEEPQCCSLAV